MLLTAQFSAHCGDSLPAAHRLRLSAAGLPQSGAESRGYVLRNRSTV